MYISPRVSRTDVFLVGDYMFASLSEKFEEIVSSIKGKAIISEEDLNVTLRQIRIALLESDVALSVVKKFIEEIRVKIIGQNVLKNVKPDQMIIKLVYDELVNILGSNNEEINLNVTPPAVILFCGLQGSGKTTSVAKLAKLLKIKNNKKILLVSTDIYRPAAQEQLEILSNENEIDFFKKNDLNEIQKIVFESLSKAKKELYDILIIDTAGRQAINKEMMDELKIISKLTNPIEKILVADSLAGQDAANTAQRFHELIGITGIFLTRIDGDSNGGAALSVKTITGAPIKYIGIGENIDQIENFSPNRIAKRILGMGDIVSLVEKASENIENKDLEELSNNISSGKFDLADFSKQLKQMKKVGGISGILSLLPGISKTQKTMAENNVTDDILAKQLAIIDSMTLGEKSNPEIIKASRKIRISKGSGTKVQEINRLLKQFIQSQKMIKRMGVMKKGVGAMDVLNNLKGNIPPNIKF